MYVHIGKDIVLNSNHIISVLDIDVLEKKKNRESNLEEDLDIMY